MRYNEAKTLGLIRHKTDVILRNGPLEELASDAEVCFRRLVDIFLVEGPRDVMGGSVYRVPYELVKRGSGILSSTHTGCRVSMPHTEWEIWIVARFRRQVVLTVPGRGWTVEFNQPYNVGSFLAIDHFLDELLRQADILSMIARIRLAERDASAPDGPAR